MCDANNTSANCEAAGHDCSQCADHESGACNHSHEAHQGERSVQEYLELTYRQNQVIVVKLTDYADKLRKAGKEEAAQQLMNAIPEFEKGNMWISLAKSLL